MFAGTIHECTFRLDTHECGLHIGIEPEDVACSSRGVNVAANSSSNGAVLWSRGVIWNKPLRGHVGPRRSVSVLPPGRTDVSRDSLCQSGDRVTVRADLVAYTVTFSRNGERLHKPMEIAHQRYRFIVATSHRNTVTMTKWS